MANDKLGRPSKEKMALLRGLVTDFLWYGKIETTLVKAKSVASKAEKLLTKAINTYTDTVKVSKTVKDDKGNMVQVEVINDGSKKLSARRQLMAFLYDKQEQRLPKESKAKFDERVKGVNHPLIEKIFNVYAPKYAERSKELGTAGGYTRVTKLGMRRGDSAPVAIVELI
ncbi:MAG: bL17 family ribosomal protein [Clostridia bacterium]